jgi:hypothetical protein
VEFIGDFLQVAPSGKLLFARSLPRPRPTFAARPASANSSPSQLHAINLHANGPGRSELRASFCFLLFRDLHFLDALWHRVRVFRTQAKPAVLNRDLIQGLAG